MINFLFLNWMIYLFHIPDEQRFTDNSSRYWFKKKKKKSKLLRISDRILHLPNYFIITRKNLQRNFSTKSKREIKYSTILFYIFFVPGNIFNEHSELKSKHFSLFFQKTRKITRAVLLTYLFVAIRRTGCCLPKRVD